MRRPCSTCVRSHTYARTHSGDKAEVSDEPDCTYGDGELVCPLYDLHTNHFVEKEQTPPSNKVEKLENRISTLGCVIILRATDMSLNDRRVGDTPGADENSARSFTECSINCFPQRQVQRGTLSYSRDLR